MRSRTPGGFLIGDTVREKSAPNAGTFTGWDMKVVTIKDGLIHAKYIHHNGIGLTSVFAPDILIRVR